MQEEVTRFEAQKASTEGELKILQNEIRGKEKPLLAPFEEKEKAARSYYEALATQRGALGERIAREEKERDALKSLEEKLQNSRTTMVLSAFLRPQQRGKTARTCPFLPTFSNPSSTLFSRQPTCAFRPSVKAVIPSIAGKAYTMPGRSRDSTWKSLTRTRDRHGPSIPCQAGKASSPPFPLPLVFQMSLSPMPGGFIWIPSWSMKALVPLIRKP